MTVSNVRVKVCEERGTTTAPTSGTTTQPGSETTTPTVTSTSTPPQSTTTQSESTTTPETTAPGKCFIPLFSIPDPSMFYIIST